MDKLLNGYRNIPEAFFEASLLWPTREVYRQSKIDPVDDCEEIPREWTGRSYVEVQKRVLAIAQYLLSLGVAARDRVAIVSNTRPEWMEADIAILSVGAATVSVYQSLTSNDIGYILFDSQAKVVFAENQEQVEKLLHLLQGKFPVPGTEEREAGEASLSITKIITFERTPEHPLVTFLGDILDQEPSDTSAVRHRYEALSRGDLAALVYTSGTTGAPKGVVQTHENHLANVRQAYEAGLYNEDTTIFLLLPLAHSFAKLMGYIGFLTPVNLRFPGVFDPRSSKANPTSVTKDLRESNAELIPVVPRLLEKMQAAIVNRSHERSLAGALVKLTLAAGYALVDADLSKQSRPFLSVVLFTLMTPIRKKMRRRLFGKNFVSAISGGAKLPLEVAKFFRCIDCEVLEGYGLTETCVATNVNRPGRARLGTVGPVLSRDIEVKIADDGEILFRGPNITSGYWNRPTATQQSWDAEKWFHTGDLGSVDKDGFLSIEGRKKELIVTSGGKKIAPDAIEPKLKACGFISQAVLMGEGKKFCVALLTLDNDAVKGWAARNSVTLSKPFHQDSHVFDMIRKEVDKVNASLASFESIKRIAIIGEEMTVDNGLLTPTFKVKRKEVAKRYAALIEGLYAEEKH